MKHFIMPCEGRITSRFREGNRPSHHGVDIAKSGNVPILSIADGFITRSYYSISYGNVVFIRHNVNGQLYESVYAHLKKREVMEDSVVEQGQIIGYMGNTGYSYGQHLHFELHVGNWNIRKSNAVDPLKYLIKTSSLDKKKLLFPYPGKLLLKGSKGINVQRIQRAVNVDADGIFGPITENAVKLFQERQGIEVDGIVGPITWTKMF
ncbi:hypothetical protein HNQ94_003225 [Salirhabdus euzebyi]|uniref:Peptidoglycan binding domain-containing protein n=1 Tax=Salirhabdus euzebyi TaxID=394506 RepID=A0A841Q8L2_9BACI|nr:peptidoglycan DD-metalloendopeptidase family protein [Salirhabdus euzebyi]MBB6454736.1 hypothetical protein [Salirhabdus euzebyi]